MQHQAPLSMEFCRQEYCSVLPFPSSGDPNQGIKPQSPELQADFFTVWISREALCEEMSLLISLTVVITSLYICISKHAIYLKYMKFLLRNKKFFKFLEKKKSW